MTPPRSKCISTFLSPTGPMLFGTVFVFALLFAPTASAATTPRATTPDRVVFVDGDTRIPVSAEKIRAWFSVQNAVRFQSGYQSEIENRSICPIAAPFFCEFTVSQRDRGALRNDTSFLLDESLVRSYLEKLNETSIAADPIDAKFSVQDGRVTAFAQSQDGRKLDIEQTLTRLSNELATSLSATEFTIPVTTETLHPKIQESDADKLGIVELISEGRTNFAGSPKNRIHNFTTGAKRFNGLLIAPGEEFSFVEHLGPVDGEHGYLPELVIKQNKTEPEFGGGICQVSTTTFRAALNAGLKITMRRNHAYPVQYYKPYGMDATIYIPKPDLRFLNNTPAHILIQTAIEGSDLVFRFYGTSDGRKTAIDGPHILAAPGDGSMKTVFTQTVTKADGSALIEDKFYSNYASPSKYPHPGQEPVFTEKPDDWSVSQWNTYKQTHNH